MLIHLPSPCDISEEMACLKANRALRVFFWWQTNSTANSTRKVCANQSESIWSSFHFLAPLSLSLSTWSCEKHRGRKSFFLTPALCHATACSVVRPGNLAARTRCCLINALSASAHAHGGIWIKPKLKCKNLAVAYAKMCPWSLAEFVSKLWFRQL